MSKPVFPQTPAKDENFNRTGGLSFRELAAIHIASQMSGAITFSALDDNKKAKNLAAIPAIAVNIADALEHELGRTVVVGKFSEPPGNSPPIILLHGGKADA